MSLEACVPPDIAIADTLPMPVIALSHHVAAPLLFICTSLNDHGSMP